MNNNDHTYGVFKKSKYVNPKLEDVLPNVPMCLTLNLNQSKLEEADSLPQVMMKYQNIFKFIGRFGTYELYPELGENCGKLHYHGWFTFKDRLSIGLFYSELITLQGCCTYALKHIFPTEKGGEDGKEKWNKYIHKQGETMKILTEYYRLPYQQVKKKVPPIEQLFLGALPDDE
jgi:hypothetical protein